jgi:replicative DNA helicase Mcm
MTFSDNQRRHKRIEQYTEFLETYAREDLGDLAQHFPQEQRSIEVEWMDIYRYDVDLAEEYRTDPGEHTEYLEEALTEVTLPVDVSLEGATVRVHVPTDDTWTYSVGATRAKHVGTYLGQYGQVAKASAIKPKLITGVFECQRCGTLMSVPQPDASITYPHECSGCERDGPWRQLIGESTYIDHQLLRVQQPPEEVQGGQGQYIDVHIEDDLVDAVQTGDRVTVSGTLELGELDESAILDTHLDGRAIRIEQTDYEDIDIEPHTDQIEQLASGEAGDPYALLVQSLAPKIQGHASIKLAIVLQLFGGVGFTRPDGTTERGDSHILLMGDPGTAKSSLLHAVEELSPRSSFVSGKGASASGLTAAAVPDDFGDSRWSLEAGALVLADKGVACIDEIDKIDPNAVSSLHGALEAQRVDVNKAGINTTLPCRAAALAAGNPTEGRFDENLHPAAQVDIAPTLLSRFDLMFVLTDNPDEERDKDLAHHLIDQRQAGIEHADTTQETPDAALDQLTPPVSREVFRAYIAHAKRTTNPRIRDDTVRENLAQSFTMLRQVNGENGDQPVPVTIRKLEAILRLAEASARVRLSETIEMEDVDRVRELVGTSLRDVGMDPETGQFDVDVIETGQSQSQKDRVRLIYDAVTELSHNGESGAPREAVIERVGSAGVSEQMVRDEIELMLDGTRKTRLYEPEAGELRVVS